MKIRKGPRVKDCYECMWYEMYKKEQEKWKWLKEVDGRAINHEKRHLAYEIAKGNVHDGLRDELWRKCPTCSDAFLIGRNSTYSNKHKKFERHYILHTGHEKFDGWYMDDWKYREDLRNAEFWFFEQMNRKHIVSRVWWWGNHPWEAIGRGYGGLEVMWTRRSDSENVYSQFFGYPNNAETDTDFPHPMRLIA